jgi:hypothetical protein
VRTTIIGIAVALSLIIPPLAAAQAAGAAAGPFTIGAEALLEPPPRDEEGARRRG